MKRRRILLADDHAEMLERARNLLASEFDVIAMVADGQSAVETTALLQPELVVLDMTMPVLSGLEAAARIARLPRAPRLVFLTVHDDTDFIDAARALGACGYVLKGSMAIDLLPAVRRALSLECPPFAEPNIVWRART